MNDPTSVLVLAGNVLDERPYGPGGAECRRGTHLYRAGTKIYLSSLEFAHAVLFDASLERIKVVGPHRRSRRWIESWMPADWVTNWRIQVLYKPGPLQRLQEADWPGFWMHEDDYHLGADRTSTAAIQEFIEAVRKRHFAEQWRRDWDHKHTARSEQVQPDLTASP